MLTGRQIREARRLLGWSRGQLARSAFLPTALVEAFESMDGPAWLKNGQEAAIRSVFTSAGVEFIAERDGGAGLRLRKADPRQQPGLS